MYLYLCVHIYIYIYIYMCVCVCVCVCVSSVYLYVCVLEIGLGNNIRKSLISPFPSLYCPVGCGCRIHRLLLCRRVRPPPNECPGNDTKQPDSEVSIMLKFWGMWSTPSLPFIEGPLWPGMVAPDRYLSME